MRPLNDNECLRPAGRRHHRGVEVLFHIKHLRRCEGGILGFHDLIRWGEYSTAGERRLVRSETFTSYWKVIAVGTTAKPAQT